MTGENDDFDGVLVLIEKLRDTCIGKGDEKTALQCIREYSKLLRLYAEERRQETENAQARELAAIREHLLPLGLTDDETTPTPELVRLLIHKTQHDGQKHATVPKKETRRGQAKSRQVAGGKKHLPDPAGEELEASHGMQVGRKQVSQDVLPR